MERHDFFFDFFCWLDFNPIQASGIKVGFSAAHIISSSPFSSILNTQGLIKLSAVPF